MTVETNLITNGNTDATYITIPNSSLLMSAGNGIILNSPTTFNASLTVGNAGQSAYIPTMLNGRLDIRSHPDAPNAINLYTHLDSQPRLQVLPNGTLMFGAGGTATPDTTLYRVANGTLRTSGNFIVGGRLEAGTYVVDRITNYPTNPLKISADSGALVMSANNGIYLNGTTMLSGPVRIGNYGQSGYVSTNIGGPIDQRVHPDSPVAFTITTHTDPNPRLRIDTSGAINFGSGGTSAPDTNLYRPSPDTLKTDDKLTAGGGLNLDAGTVLTLNSGAITASKPYHALRTEGNTSTDDLQTITGGTAGDMLVLRLATAGQSITAQDGNGNLRLRGDFTFDSDEDTLVVLYDGSRWLELSRSGNATP